MAVKVMVNSNPYGVVKSKGLLIDNFQENQLIRSILMQEFT